MGIFRLGERSPQIDPAAWVAPNATVIGDVRLAAGTSIWWNAVLRGDNEPIVIGENSIEAGWDVVRDRHARPERDR